MRNVDARFQPEHRRVAATAVLLISADLPFAVGRFSTSAGLNSLTPLSAMRVREFMRDDSVEIATGVRAGLTARAVVVLDETDVVKHVHEIKNEPNGDAVLVAPA